MKHFLILAALMLAACTLPGAPDTNGLGSIMHPSQDYCASRELTLDAATKQCVTPSQARTAPATTPATTATATAATATTPPTSAPAPAVTGSVPQVAQAGHSASPGPAAPASPSIPAPAQPLPQEHRAARSVPIEPDALIHRELAQDFDLMYELAHFVRASGYRCDSISALQPLSPARGYKLVCNRFSYKYAIDNKDGRSIVTAE